MSVQGQTDRAAHPSRTRPYPPPGALVDVGGYHLHVNCSGQGQPAVVIDAGFGDFSLGWHLVQPEVARFARVCTYDRAGYGWSDPGPRPRTSGQAVKELHALLAGAGIEGPYVLVGQSGGGLNARLYAHEFPDQVVGMVLVDPGHEDQWSRMPAQAWQIQVANMQMIKSLSLLARLRLLKLLGRLIGPPEFVRKLPPEVQPAYLAALDANYFQTFLDEFASFDASAAQVRAAGALGDMPLVVLTGGALFDQSRVRLPASFPMQETRQAWVGLHAELANLSSSGEHIVIEGSGHAVHLDRPDVVVDAIRRVVEAARDRETA